MTFVQFVIIFQNHELYLPFQHSTTQVMLSSLCYLSCFFSFFQFESILNLTFTLCSNKSVNKTAQCARRWESEELIESEWGWELDWRFGRKFWLSKPFPNNSNLVHIEFEQGKPKLDFALYTKNSYVMQKSWQVFVFNQ